MHGKRLTIYIGERDHYRNTSLYLAILYRLKEAGCAGATVTRGIAGFGAHSQIKTIRLLELSVDLPIVITIVDSSERIARLLPEISAMMAGGTMTLEDTEIIFTSAAFTGGLPEIAVAEVMRTQVETVRPETPVRSLVQRLVEHDFSGLPVVDEQGVLVGFVNDTDLLGAHLTALSVSEHRALDAGLVADVLRDLESTGARVADVMRTPAITAPQSASLREVAHLMHAHSVKHVPIVDQSGHLVGVVGRLDILRSIVSGFQARAGEQVRPLPQERALVADVMVAEVPNVPDTMPLTDVLGQLLASAARQLVVVDADGRPVGVITATDVIARIDADARPGLLLLLKSRFSEEAGRAVRRSLGERAADIMTSPVVTIAAKERVISALSLMVAQHLKHLPVVDEAGRLVGVVTRAMVLAASLATAPTETT